MRDNSFCPASVTNSKFILIAYDKNLPQSNSDSGNREIPTYGDFRLRLSLLIRRLFSEKVAEERYFYCCPLNHNYELFESNSQPFHYIFSKFIQKTEKFLLLSP